MRKLFLTLTFFLLCNLGFSQNVIDPRLQDVMNQKGDEMIDINIIFKSQIDYKQLRNRANTTLDKEVRRDMMVEELRLFSEEKQQEILSFLRAEKSGERVTNIRTYWLSNAISCTASRDVIYMLAEHPDIEIIGYDEWQRMIPEESLQDYKSTSQRDGDLDITDNIKMVNADKVWDLGYTGKGVIVAVIDSGVNYNHADLKDHLWDGGAGYPHHGWNVVDNNNDPMDGTGHGTHCAGTICGDGTSGVQTGMAPDATLMCIKALDNYGFGSASTFNAGMEFAIEHHADILSMSMGIMNASTADKTWLRNTCVNALELGVIASVAAGNDGNMMMAPVPNNVRTPGNCPPPWLHPDQEINPGGLSCVVTVGAIDYSENMYENESKGPVTWTDTQFNDYPYGGDKIGLIRPDVCAPGVGIKSLDGDTDNGYNLKSGTSMATPCVAGVMALLLEKNSELTPAEICMTLETTAKKLTETKSNIHGSGLIDAFKAVTSIKKGSFNLIGFDIKDDNGNNNNKVNAGETVKLSVSLNNDSELSFENIKAVMSCNNGNVTMKDDEAVINNIAANDEITLTDEFEFAVSKEANHKEPLVFKLEFFNENETLIASFDILVTVYNSELVFASFVIDNDDNGNGVLEAGETANIGVIINNVGNEIAVEVKGVLSSSDSKVTINQNEGYFNTVGAESSAVAYFNISVAENAGENLDIPFDIKVTDAYGNEKNLNGRYISSCKYIFQLEDSKWDGWDGAYLLVKYSNGKPTDSLTVESGWFQEYSIFVESNVEVTLEWKSGEYDEECSFYMLNGNYETIFTSPKFPVEDNILLTFVNDCSCQNEYYTMCDTVENLSGEQVKNGIMLSWTTKDSIADAKFEIYRETKLLGSTSEYNFTDNTVSEEGEYYYSVRMITDDCVGFFQSVKVTYSDDFVPDNVVNEVAINVSVYPNPSNNDFTIVCNEIMRITVYNIIGNKIMEDEVNADKYIISGLETGVYFVDITTNEGKCVKRIIKL